MQTYEFTWNVEMLITAKVRGESLAEAQAIAEKRLSRKCNAIERRHNVTFGDPDEYTGDWIDDGSAARNYMP